MDSRRILRRAKALFDVPQFVAGNWAVDSSIGRRPLVSRRSACDRRSRRHGGLACSLCGGRRGTIDLDWVMDAACGGRRGGDSDHRHHFCTPIRFVVGDLRCRGLVAGHAGAGSLVLRCSLVWPQTHHIALGYRRQKPPSQLDMDARGCAYATCAGMRSSSSVPAFPSLQTRR